MAALNKVQIIGNLGKDPETKTVGQSTVANFSVQAFDIRFVREDRIADGSRIEVNRVTVHCTISKTIKIACYSHALPLGKPDFVMDGVGVLTASV